MLRQFLVPLPTAPPSGESFWQMLRRQMRMSCLVYSIFSCSAAARSRHLQNTFHKTYSFMHLTDAFTLCNLKCSYVTNQCVLSLPNMSAWSIFRHEQSKLLYEVCKTWSWRQTFTTHLNLHYSVMCQTYQSRSSHRVEMKVCAGVKIVNRCLLRTWRAGEREQALDTELSSASFCVAAALKSGWFSAKRRRAPPVLP